MIGKIEFPAGITWKQKYITGGDFLGTGYESPSASKLYYSTSNSEIYVNWDTSRTSDMSSMFEKSSCKRVLNLNTSSATNLSKLFYSSSLEFAPQLNTSNVTDMSGMFGTCKIATIPPIDMSNVTNVNQMFYYCSQLKILPDLNCSKVTNFGASTYDSWLYYDSNLRSIGVIDCDSVTNISYFFGDGSRTYLTEFGGCRNLGKANTVSNTNGPSFLQYAPNLTYESVMNVLNLLYDRASAGLSVLTLKLHPNHLAMLSEDDIAVATSKGWTLV
jgi:hypothetical protein